MVKRCREKTQTQTLSHMIHATFEFKNLKSTPELDSAHQAQTLLLKFSLETIILDLTWQTQ